MNKKRRKIKIKTTISPYRIKLGPKGKEVEKMTISENSLVAQTMDTGLAEFVCDKCMESTYRPFIYISKEGHEYPNLDRLNTILYPNGPERHIAEVLSDKGLTAGYSHCGYYRLARVWKAWENPDRLQGHVDRVAAFSNNPLVKKLTKIVADSKNPMQIAAAQNELQQLIDQRNKHD